MSIVRTDTCTIKGMTANLCAEALRETIIRMELAAKAGDVALLRSLLPELEEQVGRVAVEIRKSSG